MHTPTTSCAAAEVRLARLSPLDRLCHYDALVIGFANFWAVQPSCAGPTEPGLDALPQLNTNACIQTGPAWLGKPALWDGCALTQCGGCGGGTVGEAVLEYQRQVCTQKPIDTLDFISWVACSPALPVGLM